MTDAIKLIIDYILDLFSLINDRLTFELFGVEVHFLSLALAGVVLVMVVSVFWKGVKG